jgi:hypothetical protein
MLLVAKTLRTGLRNGEKRLNLFDSDHPSSPKLLWYYLVTTRLKLPS